MVSSTVRDLVAGSGLTFEDRSQRKLKGVLGTWQLYAVSRDVRRGLSFQPQTRSDERIAAWDSVRECHQRQAGAHDEPWFAQKY
jgi:hypothetical protein